MTQVVKEPQAPKKEKSKEELAELRKQMMKKRKPAASA